MAYEGPPITETPPGWVTVEDLRDNLVEYLAIQSRYSTLAGEPMPDNMLAEMIESMTQLALATYHNVGLGGEGSLVVSMNGDPLEVIGGDNNELNFEQGHGILLEEELNDNGVTIKISADNFYQGWGLLVDETYYGSIENNEIVNFVSGDGIDIGWSDHLENSINISHTDTSSVTNLIEDNADGVVIQDLTITYDEFGHVQTSVVGTIDLDLRYSLLAHTNTHLSLTDTPSNYTGAGNYFVRVNGTPDALEYVAASSISLSDFNNDLTYDNYTGWQLYVDTVDKGNIGSGEKIDFKAGTGMTIVHSTTNDNTITFTSSAGGGNVFKVGIPVDNQIGVWTGDGTIEGTASLTFGSGTLNVNGIIDATNSIIGSDLQTETTVLFTETTSGAAPGATQGFLYMDQADDKIKFRNSTTIYDLTAGGGDVYKVGTPVDNQIGIWTGDGTIEGTDGFKFGATDQLNMTGDRAGSVFIVTNTNASGIGISATGTIYDYLAIGSGIYGMEDRASDPAFGSSKGGIYTKTDGKLYFRYSTGTAYDLTASGGDVYKVGTPVDNQIGIWTGDGTIQGDVDLTFDGTKLSIGSGTTPSPVTIETGIISLPLYFNSASSASGYGHFWGKASTSLPMWTNTTDTYSFDMTAASDFWKKKNFKLIDSPLDKILSLQSYQFDWNSNYPKEAPTDNIEIILMHDKNKRDAAGLIAQEVEKIIPEIVSEVDDSGYKQVDYKAIVPYLIEAIKEQQGQINKLKQQLR